MSQGDKDYFLQLIVGKPKESQGLQIFKQSGFRAFNLVGVEVTPYFFKAINLCCEFDDIVKCTESPAFAFQRQFQTINKNLRQNLITPPFKSPLNNRKGPNQILERVPVVSDKFNGTTAQI